MLVGYIVSQQCGFLLVLSSGCTRCGVIVGVEVRVPTCSILVGLSRVGDGSCGLHSMQRGCLWVKGSLI